MKRIEILLPGEIEGGMAPFVHGDLDIRFHRLAEPGDLPLLEGGLWAFIGPGIGPEGAGSEGLEICRRLRCHPRTAQARITLLLDVEDAEARGRALRAGVDDIMVGAMTRRAVLDRVLTDTLSLDDDRETVVLRHGDLSMDILAFQARWANKPIALMPNEFRLLRFFVEHAGRIYTRSQLITALGKHDTPIDERTVDVWIGRLRRALRAAGAPDILRTVRSLGYILDKP
ncbi:MAG: response regulator transcription factor [Novosphingobium sp.]|nr:response regulator transcription factor [Novosphingobium sp.]